MNIKELFPLYKAEELAASLDATSFDEHLRAYTITIDNVSIYLTSTSARVTCYIQLKASNTYITTGFNPDRGIKSIAAQLKRWIGKNKEALESDLQRQAENAAFEKLTTNNIKKLEQYGVESRGTSLYLCGSCSGEIAGDSIIIDYLSLSVDQAIELQKMLLKSK